MLQVNTMLVVVVLTMPITARADQYTAFSLRVAQQPIEQAGENWEQKGVDAVSLAGINKVEGFIFESATDQLRKHVEWGTVEKFQFLRKEPK